MIVGEFEMSLVIPLALMAQIGLFPRLIILALNAWTLYWWFKRQRWLDTLANIVRVAAISSGVALAFVTAHLLDTHPQNTLQVMRFVGLPATALIVVFLFFPDASYFVAAGL